MKAFLDIEGTGTQHNQIAQLAYIITDDELNVVCAKNFFFKVENMNPFAQRLHGLSIEYLRRASDGATFADHYSEIQHDLGNTLLVCHNTRSDYDLLASEYSRLGNEYTPQSHFCTMAHFKPICEIYDRSGKVKPPSLRELIDYHQISNEMIYECATKLFACRHVQPHDSRFDAAAIFLVCQHAVTPEDFSLHQPHELPVHGPAEVVPLAAKRQAKAAREQNKKKTVPRHLSTPRYAKWAIPVLAGLIILSLLLRMR